MEEGGCGKGARTALLINPTPRIYPTALISPTGLKEGVTIAEMRFSIGGIVKGKKCNVVWFRKILLNLRAEWVNGRWITPQASFPAHRNRQYIVHIPAPRLTASVSEES